MSILKSQWRSKFRQQSTEVQGPFTAVYVYIACLSKLLNILECHTVPPDTPYCASGLPLSVKCSTKFLGHDPFDPGDCVQPINGVFHWPTTLVCGQRSHLGQAEDLI